MGHAVSAGKEGKSGSREAEAEAEAAAEETDELVVMDGKVKKDC